MASCFIASSVDRSKIAVSLSSTGTPVAIAAQPVYSDSSSEESSGDWSPLKSELELELEQKIREYHQTSDLLLDPGFPMWTQAIGQKSRRFACERRVLHVIVRPDDSALALVDDQGNLPETLCLPEEPLLQGARRGLSDLEVEATPMGMVRLQTQTSGSKVLLKMVVLSTTSDQISRLDGWSWGLHEWSPYFLKAGGLHGLDAFLEGAESVGSRCKSATSKQRDEALISRVQYVFLNGDMEVLCSDDTQEFPTFGVNLLVEARTLGMSLGKEVYGGHKPSRIVLYSLKEEGQNFKRPTSELTCKVLVFPPAPETRLQCPPGFQRIPLDETSLGTQFADCSLALPVQFTKDLYVSSDSSPRPVQYVADPITSDGEPPVIPAQLSAAPPLRPLQYTFRYESSSDRDSDEDSLSDYEISDEETGSDISSGSTPRSISSEDTWPEFEEHNYLRMGDYTDDVDEDSTAAEVSTSVLKECYKRGVIESARREEELLSFHTQLKAEELPYKEFDYTLSDAETEIVIEYRNKSYKVPRPEGALEGEVICVELPMTIHGLKQFEMADILYEMRRDTERFLTSDKAREVERHRRLRTYRRIRGCNLSAEPIEEEEEGEEVC